MGESKEKVSVTLAIVGGLFIFLPMEMRHASPIPDYQGTLFEGVWYYGMIFLGVCMMGLGFIFNTRR